MKPVFCGKPEKLFFQELCHRLSVAPDWCVLIGDNLEADVFGAKAMGMRTILSMGGVTRPSDLEALAPELRPDLVVADLTELA